MSDLYGAAFDRAAEKAGEHVDRVLRERDEADSLLQDLLSEPLDRRRERVRAEPRLWLLNLCDRLEDASREAWALDPATAVERAELAVEIAGRLDVLGYGEPLVEDARALAWAYLGNAWRIASDLPRAEEALARALDHHRRFEVDLVTEAEILGFQASLRNSQGRFREALELLDRPCRSTRRSGTVTRRAAPSSSWEWCSGTPAPPRRRSDISARVSRASIPRRSPACSWSRATTSP